LPPTYKMLKAQDSVIIEINHIITNVCS